MPFIRHSAIGSRRTLRIGLGVVLLVVMVVVVQDRLARPSLNRFEPTRMAGLESSMWRNYYEHRWVGLATDGLRVSCGEYGFSWWDGLTTSVLAARAAYHFRDDTMNPHCLPLLERYYGRLGDSLGVEFDTGEAARLELKWWRERRRKLPPDVYGGTIAEATALLYQLSAESLSEASLLRARAMDYRDRHGRKRGMTEEDWAEVTRRLEAAYRSLERAAKVGAI